MSKAIIPDLSGVSETLLIPLCYRAAESQRPDALIRDERAIELANRIEYDLSRFKRQAFEQLVAMMRARELDRWTREFLAGEGGAVVVEIGCGLDTRFFRLDDGRVEWYDLDLPPAIALRRELIAETPRCHTIACSALDLSWLDAVQNVAARPILFLAEGVFPYLEPAGLQRLVPALAARFPGSALIFDAVPPFVRWADRLHPSLKGMQARVRWAMRRGRELEAWGPGIRLLGEWHYFDQPEPRLGLYRLLRWVPPFGQGFRIVRYRLGGQANAEGGSKGNSAR